MWIERSISPLLQQTAATRPALVLTGARQTGKTSLIRRLFPDHHYVSLDLPAEARSAEDSPRAFLERHPAPLIIDEVQYAPALFRHLKLAIDADRDACGRYLLTGSQPFVLMKEVGDSLAGRIAVLALEGLSWQEARQALPDAPIEELVWRGGFPELYARPAIDVARFHADYVATYLERDLRNLLRVGDLREFDRFLRACAARTAGLLNMADLGRDCDISGPTVRSWLTALERSGQLQLLEPWFTNRGKGLTKSPKLHLADSGLACFLTAHHTPADLLASPLAGNLWETAVCAELRKAQLNTSGRHDLHYFRNRTREADFIIQRAGRILCADAKWTEQPGAKDIRQVEAVLDLLDRSGNAAILCRTATSHPLTQRTRACSPEDMASLPAMDDPHPPR